MSDRVATPFGFESTAADVIDGVDLTGRSAIDSKPKAVVTRSLIATSCAGNGLLGIAGDAPDDRCGGVRFDDHVDGFAGPDRYVLGVTAADALAERRGDPEYITGCWAGEAVDMIVELDAAVRRAASPATAAAASNSTIMSTASPAQTGTYSGSPRRSARASAAVTPGTVPSGPAKPST